MSPRDLSKLGWRSRGPLNDLNLDFAGESTLQLSRAWSPNGRYESIPAPGRLNVLLLVEGSANVLHDGAPVEIQANQLILLDAEAPANVEVTNPSARFGWSFSPSVLDRAGLSSTTGEPLSFEPDAVRPLLSLTNSVLNAGTTGGHDSALSIATEHLLLSSIRRSPKRSARQPTTVDAIRAEAQSVIEDNFRDPAFGVDSLRQSLNVSERHLRRAFSILHTSPRREIEARRVREVLSLPHSAALLRPRELDELAQSCGFTSIRRMRHALDRAAISN